jgi:tight adherence protein C
MLLLIISVSISAFLLTLTCVITFSRETEARQRLMEVAALGRSEFGDEGPKSLAATIAGYTRVLAPIRHLIMSNDEDLGYRLALAGYRKPEHIEVYVAIRLLLPVLGLLSATLVPSNGLVVGLIGIAVGFFAPDYVLTSMVAARRRRIELALPDALDLLVICMEAGLGIDQALVRVSEEMRSTAPDLADEFQTISREQRAGKPRLEAWRSMAERVDLDVVRQFVSMLVQTERCGTPIAHSLGQFADSLRLRRTQQAEEMAAKTTVKLVFPLVLFIFPSLFVVLLGPAMISISKSLGEMTN